MPSEDVVAFKHAFCPECGPVENIDEDGCCLMCGADIVGTKFDGLMASKGAAEAALCRAREAFKVVRDSTWGGNAMEQTLVVKVGPMHLLQDALDNFYHDPCPHAAEVERLKKCGSCGEPLSNTCQKCQRLWES